MVCFGRYYLCLVIVFNYSLVLIVLQTAGEFCSHELIYTM